LYERPVLRSPSRLVLATTVIESQDLSGSKQSEAEIQPQRVSGGSHEQRRPQAPAHCSRSQQDAFSGQESVCRISSKVAANPAVVFDLDVHLLATIVQRRRRHEPFENRSRNNLEAGFSQPPPPSRHAVDRCHSQRSESSRRDRAGHRPANLGDQPRFDPEAARMSAWKRPGRASTIADDNPRQEVSG